MQKKKLVFKKKQFIQVKQNELKLIRSKIHTSQSGVCPILKKKFPLEDMVVDHQHCSKAETIGKNGAGLIRGVIQRQANSIEGKFINAFRRYGLHNHITISDFLRNLADYLDRKPTNYIHPTERVKQPALQRSSYNKLKKVYNGRAALPPYPRSGKLTIKLRALFNKYRIKPEFYSK